jgi:hypothetical protein
MYYFRSLRMCRDDICLDTKWPVNHLVLDTLMDLALVDTSVTEWERYFISFFRVIFMF